MESPKEFCHICGGRMFVPDRVLRVKDLIAHKSCYLSASLTETDETRRYDLTQAYLASRATAAKTR